MSTRKAWTQKRGETWHVQWYELVDGKRVRRSKSIGPRKRDAEEFAKSKATDLSHVAEAKQTGKSWPAFRAEFEDWIAAKVSHSSLTEYVRSLGHFERIIKPKTVASISTRDIDTFVAKRLKEPGKTAGSTVSKGSVNKDLRGIKRALRRAKVWKYRSDVPEFEMVKVGGVEPTFISPDEFTQLYVNCKDVDRPVLPGVTPGEWWQAFLITAYLTGWRVSELRSLRWEDVDLFEGVAIVRAENAKNGRESITPLHDTIIEHLKQLPSDDDLVFPWTGGERGFSKTFERLQHKSGVRKVCRKPKPHRCSDACLYYGMHDLRRGFATQNAADLSPSQLQTMMRHSSYTVTQGYIALAEQTRNRRQVVSKLTVPSLEAK